MVEAMNEGPTIGQNKGLEILIWVLGEMLIFFVFIVLPWWLFRGG
jgi:hypothetical protein